MGLNWPVLFYFPCIWHATATAPVVAPSRRAGSITVTEEGIFGTILLVVSPDMHFVMHTSTMYLFLRVDILCDRMVRRRSLRPTKVNCQSCTSSSTPSG